MTLPDEQLIQALMLRAPDPGAPDQFAPLMREAMRLQNEAAQRAVRQPDTSGYAQAGHQRELQGRNDIAAGLAMATALPEFRQMAQQTHGAGLEALQPMQMGEGTYFAGRGYVPDPYKQQDRLTKAVASQAGAAAQFAGAFGEEANRKAAQADRALQRIHQQQVFDEQRRHQRVMEGISGGNLALSRQQHELGKIQVLENADGSKTAYRISMTPQGPQMVPLSPLGGMSGGTTGGAPGTARFPATPSTRATEDERRVAYQTDSIIASAPTAYAPGSVGPGKLEALARTMIPGAAGEAVANFLSPAPRQMARASQESIVDALLWLSTGAAYNDPQLQQRKREVMAQLTDDRLTLEFKRAKVAELVVGARNRAGRAWTQAQEDKLLAAFPELLGGDSPLARFSQPSGMASTPGSSAPSAPGAPARPGDAYLRKPP